MQVNDEFLELLRGWWFDALIIREREKIESKERFVKAKRWQIRWIEGLLEKTQIEDHRYDKIKCSLDNYTFDEAEKVRLWLEDEMAKVERIQDPKKQFKYLIDVV